MENNILETIVELKITNHKLTTQIKHQKKVIDRLSRRIQNLNKEIRLLDSKYIIELSKVRWCQHNIDKLTKELEILKGSDKE